MRAPLARTAGAVRSDAVFHLGDTRAQVDARGQELRGEAKANPFGGIVGPADPMGFFRSAPYYDSCRVPVAQTFAAWAAGDEHAPRTPRRSPRPRPPPGGRSTTAPVRAGRSARSPPAVR
ncbi:hypothetical protein [Streptomyces sp. NPDC090021]|uniref:hypothetical protein n=1 Tax=Streptomyces sp. NPDC090021 TaxID=3365919 RepID=UPI00380B0137